MCDIEFTTEEMMLMRSKILLLECDPSCIEIPTARTIDSFIHSFFSCLAMPACPFVFHIS